jgi:hypothetical protein
MFMEYVEAGIILAALMVDLGASLNGTPAAHWHSGKSGIKIRTTIVQKVRILCALIWRVDLGTSIARDPALTVPGAMTLAFLLLWIVIESERVSALVLSVNITRFKRLAVPWYWYVCQKARFNEWAARGIPNLAVRGVTLLMMAVPVTYLMTRLSGALPA